MHIRWRCLLSVICLNFSAAAQVASGGSVATAVTDVSPLEPTVPFGVWIGAVTEVLESTVSPSLDREYTDFAERHELDPSDPRLRRDFRNLRLLFEAVRDGGFWHLRWDVTNRYPSSKEIWKTWMKSPVTPGFDKPSATAECDESSALLGLLARRTGVKNVGLFYPTWNHTIAAWAPLEGRRKKTLVLLPTTQIFLDCEAGFDHTSFKTSLTNIERYPGWDIRDSTSIPLSRAQWLLTQLEANAQASPTLWDLMRAKRAYHLGSSVGVCAEARKAYSARLASNLTPGDERALAALSQVEGVGQRLSPAELLHWLAE